MGKNREKTRTKKRMKRKGFLFTIGLVLLTLTVLTHAVLFANQSRSSMNLLADSAAFDRLHDLSSSIDHSFREILSAASGIELSPDNATVIIEENIPASPSEFRNAVDSLESLVENTSNVVLNTEQLKSELPLAIYQNTKQNITYYHHPYGGNNITIYYDPGNITIESIYFYAQAYKNVSCIWNMGGGDVDLRLDIDVLGDNQCSRERSVSINNPGRIRIIAEDDEAAIQTGNGFISVYTSNMSMRLRTEIKMKNKIERIEALGGMDIEISRFNISKSGYIRII